MPKASGIVVEVSNLRPEDQLNILVFSYNIPSPQRNSGERRFTEILRLLAASHRVDLFVTKHRKAILADFNSPAADVLRSWGVTLLSPSWLYLFQQLRAIPYRVGFFEFYWLARKTLPFFRLLQPRAVTIVDSVDVHFARQFAQAELGMIARSTAARTRLRELATYRQADFTIAVSNDDREILFREGLGPSVLVPNIITPKKRASERRQPIVLFIGSYKWPPNVDAVLWFTSTIWPLIHQRNHDALFQIVGTDPPEAILQLGGRNNICVLGWVPDTSPLLDKAAVSVAPLRYGGGMKGKVNEAMGHGVPVVTTTVGAQGIPATDGIHLFIKDEPEVFAEAVLSLLADANLQQQVGLAGQELNNNICAPHVIEQSLHGMFTQAETIAKQREKQPAGRLRMQHLLHTIRCLTGLHAAGDHSHAR